MKQFVITVKRNGETINQLEKVPFDLNTSRNIVRQAQEKVASLLAGQEISVENIAWKVYRVDGNRFSFVSRSENWAGD